MRKMDHVSLPLARRGLRRRTGRNEVCAAPLSVAVRLPAAAGLGKRCVDTLRALGNVEVRRLEEAGSIGGLDLILDLTSRPAHPAHIPGPRFGYWTFLYGETPERIAPGLTEILTGRRAAFVRLARLAPGGKAIILREGPESCALGRVQLFRAVEFPHRWVPDSVLLEGFAGADASVIRYRGRWWMFTGNHADQDEAKLFIFHSEELRGPWTPHARNPVKCDLRSSRPAGTAFIGQEGPLYRPAQDGSRVYGGAMTINRVIRLTPDEFEEEVAARLQPDPAGPCPDGMHTLSAVGNLTLVDGKRHELLPAPLAAARDRLRALARSVS